MLKELELHDGLVINTDDISTISRQDVPQPPLTVTGLVIYDSFRYEQPYSPMDEIYDKFKESLGLGFDKELRITDSEVIHRDGNSIQLKLTCEF